MATRRWLGKAAAVAQVTTVQITGYDAATTYTLTVNNKTVSVTGDTDADTTASNLATAWNNSTEPEFAEITASVATDTITLTADTPGKPFTVTSSVNGGSGTIGSPSTTTSSAGPNHWDTAANWSGATVPVSSDTVVIENSDVSIKYGLDQNAVTLTLLVIEQSFTGQIGLAEINSDSTEYSEYRDTYLKISATNVEIGGGDGEATGASRIKINLGSNQAAIDVFNTGTPETDQDQAVLLVGTHASNSIQILAGSVGVAVIGGESATLATIKQSGGELVCGSGVTLSSCSVTIAGGELAVESNISSIEQNGGTVTVLGSATVGTANNHSGTLNYQSSGTITTLQVGGTVDFTQDLSSRTVTNATILSGATLLDPLKTVTWSNGVDLYGCSLADVTVDLGMHWTLTPSAI